MKKGIKLTLGLLLACSCTYAQQTYQVSGRLEGIKTDSIIVMLQSENFMRTERMDTLALQEGKFGFDVPADGVRAFIIVAKPGPGEPFSADPCINELAVPGEQVRIEGTLDDYTLSGSAFYQEYAAAKALMEDDTKAFTDLRRSVVERMKAGENRDSLQVFYEKEAGKILSRIEDTAWKYVQSHPDSDVSAYFLTALGDKTDDALALLSDRVKSGVMAPMVKTIADMRESQKQREAAAGKVYEGGEAPDFTLNDLDGKPLTLSSLRGKYVVLDFWGSWCGWCIKGFPEMKEAYAKYKGKVEFLGIACNDTDKRWRAAVAKHELPWLNVLNTGATDVSALYAIEGYPTKMVIDPEGKIAKIVVGESPEFYTYLKELFE